MSVHSVVRTQSVESVKERLIGEWVCVHNAFTWLQAPLCGYSEATIDCSLLMLDWEGDSGFEGAEERD